MNKTISASIWSTIERVGVQATSFLIGIVLARLLSPEDYGLIGITSIFIAFSNIFIDSGFGNALIRKKERTNVDLSTTFFFNLTMGVVLYILLYFTAPIIATYFDDDILTPLVRIVGLTILLNSICIVQVAVMTAELRIKEQTIINIISLIPSGIVAIWLAYKGFGVYALAIQSVLGSALKSIMLWVVAKWRPICTFSKKSMTYLWGFGSRLLGANLLGTFFNEIYTIIIGKYLSKNDVGLYSKGRSLSTQPESICNGVVQKVGYPYLSKFQDDKSVLKLKYQEMTMMITCVMSLVSILLITLASPIILLILGEKWVGTVWIFQLLVLSNMVSYISYLTLILLQVLNKTSFTLKLEFIKKPIFLVIIILAVKFELRGLMWGQVLISLLATIVNMSAPSKYIGYAYREQIKDVLLYYISAVITFVCSLVLNLVPIESNIISILVKVPILTATYCGILLLARDDCFCRYAKLSIIKIKQVCAH